MDYRSDGINCIKDEESFNQINAGKNAQVYLIRVASTLILTYEAEKHFYQLKRKVRGNYPKYSRFE